MINELCKHHVRLLGKNSILVSINVITNGRGGGGGEGVGVGRE